MTLTEINALGLIMARFVVVIVCISFYLIEGLIPVTRNLCIQSAWRNRSGWRRYFPEAIAGEHDCLWGQRHTYQTNIRVRRLRWMVLSGMPAAYPAQHVTRVILPRVGGSLGVRLCAICVFMPGSAANVIRVISFPKQYTYSSHHATVICVNLR